MISLLRRNKELNNASWLIAGKIVQMLLSLLIGIWTARYLGPGNFGAISYANSYVALFMSFCTLGINSVIVKEFTDRSEKAGEILGTSIGLRMISSFFSALVIIGIVSIVDMDEPTTIAVAALCSISLLFHVFDTFNYWFQYQYRSKITAIATLIAYIATSVYRLILIISGRNILWFAMATSVDYVVLGLVLYFVYKRQFGPPLKFCWATGKQILRKSYHYILSGMMVAIYGQTDRLMLKQMLDDTCVGYYTTATTVCSMWVFVLTAVIDSIYPTIMRLHKENYPAYERKNRQLYTIVFYLSVAVSLGFLLLGNQIIYILYGIEYAAAAPVLKVVTWYTAFSYLGVARNAWIICENKQHYLKLLYLAAAILNVGLNALLIPRYGAIGAALASLATEISCNLLLPALIKDLRPNVKLMLHAISLKDVRQSFRQKT